LVSVGPQGITIMRPETIVRWHRAGFRRYWRWKSRSLVASFQGNVSLIWWAIHSPGLLWQNRFAERLIGSIRWECLDHLVVVGEAHPRRILGAYAAYYNVSRTHRSLDKGAP
jgi:hypothetical protein